MEKKGVIHTLEALIAILIVLSFSYLLSVQTGVVQPQQTPEAVLQAEKIILSEASLNSTYREQCILSLPPSVGGGCETLAAGYPCVARLADFMREHAPPGFQSVCEICDRAMSCMTSTVLPADRGVYSNSIMLASNPSRVFRLYFWEQ